MERTGFATTRGSHPVCRQRPAIADNAVLEPATEQLATGREWTVWGAPEAKPVGAHEASAATFGSTREGKNATSARRANAWVIPGHWHLFRARSSTWGRTSTRTQGSTPPSQCTCTIAFPSTASAHTAPSRVAWMLAPTRSLAGPVYGSWGARLCPTTLRPRHPQPMRPPDVPMPPTSPRRGAGAYPLTTTPSHPRCAILRKSTRPDNRVNSIVLGTSRVGAAVGDGASSNGPSPTIDTTGLVWTGSIGGSSTPPISSASHGTATSRPTLVRTLTSPSGFSPTSTKRAWRGVRTMPRSSTSARLGRTRRSCADAWKRIAPTNETRAAPAEPFATVAVSAASPSDNENGAPPSGSTRTATRVVLPEVSHRPRSVARGSASPSEGPSGAICRGPSSTGSTKGATGSPAAGACSGATVSGGGGGGDGGGVHAARPTRSQPNGRRAARGRGGGDMARSVRRPRRRWSGCPEQPDGARLRRLREEQLRRARARPRGAGRTVVTRNRPSTCHVLPRAAQSRQDPIVGPKGEHHETLLEGRHRRRSRARARHGLRRLQGRAGGERLPVWHRLSVRQRLRLRPRLTTFDRSPA